VVTIKDSNLVGANASSIRPGDRHRTILYRNTVGQGGKSCPKRMD